MKINKNNFNERGEMLSYELNDVFVLEGPLPVLQHEPSSFPHEKSNIPSELFESAYRSFVGKYPFKDRYVNAVNPYTKKRIESKADYYLYLREHCYYHLCDRYVEDEKNKVDFYVREADTKIAHLQSKTESLEKELAVADHDLSVLSNRNETLGTKLNDTARKLSRTRRIAGLIVVALLAFILLCVSNVISFEPQSKTRNYADGYATGLADQRAADEKERNQSYASGQTDGYKSGYSDGKAVGYSDGYSDGEDSGYRSGYSSGKLDGYSSGYSVGYEEGKEDGYSTGYDRGSAEAGKRSSGSGSSGSGSSGHPGTGSSRDTPIANTYIGNKNSKKFHKPTCSYLPDQNNQVTFSSRDAAISAGYTPCGHCNP